MTQIIEDIEAHYDTTEVPFGRIYHWHHAHLSVECDCSEKLTFSGTSTITTCRRCGADYDDVVHDIHYREGHLRDAVAHPWHYDTQEQAKQHLRDETAYPKDSPWRYNDITSGSIHGK